MIAKFLALYLALSMAASAAYNLCPEHAGDGWWLEIGGGADK